MPEKSTTYTAHTLVHNHPSCRFSVSWILNLNAAATQRVFLRSAAQSSHHPVRNSEYTVCWLIHRVSACVITYGRIVIRDIAAAWEGLSVAIRCCRIRQRSREVWCTDFCCASSDVIVLSGRGWTVKGLEGRRYNIWVFLTGSKIRRLG